MDSHQLFTDLISAYSDKNLNKISGKLIELYKAKNFDNLKEIANKVSKYLDLEEENDIKYFSRLIILYHPDKGGLYRKQIENIYRQGEYEKLTRYSHILELSGLDKIKVTSIKKQEAVEDESEYVWDSQNDDGFEYYNGDEQDYFDDEEFDADNDSGLSFYNAVKVREYGRLNIEFPPYYLEDFEDINFADSEINSLDGISYCKHVVNLDLSNNNISDVSEIVGLGKIKELYLANNSIGFIDALGGLLHLELVDLANNEIDDISPLFNLEKLQFVNLIGNKVPQTQLEILKKNNVIVLN